MPGGGENHFIIIQVTFCHIGHLSHLQLQLYGAQIFVSRYKPSSAFTNLLQIVVQNSLIHFNFL